MNTQYVSMEFDAKQMIRLLGNDLYDSPWAMLRENVQNAYDAILERQGVDLNFSPKIDIVITNEQVIVQDNGIGMNGEILAQNYWKAGNSSKNNPRSIAAGVVGHFGIGALANFGVCTKLELKTRRLDEECSYSTSAIRDNLNIKDSIPITVLDKDATAIGTRVEATLECPGSITPLSAINYLHQYIDYLPIPVYINGEEFKRKQVSFVPKITNKIINEGAISYTMDLTYGSSFPLDVEIKVYNIKYMGADIKGYLYLNSKINSIMGLRNGFGLANVNVMSSYNFGGVANLDNLTPTAGREAISRESASVVSVLVRSIEGQWTEIICTDPICDSYREYLIYASNNYRDSYARNIKIKLANEDSFICLGEITKDNATQYKYADGVDSTVLAKFKNSTDCVLTISDVTHRKKIQRTYLQQVGVLSIPNNVQVIKEYSDKDISIDQFFVLGELKSIIEEDYYVKGFDIKIADISHYLRVFVTHNLAAQTFCIYLSPDNEELKHLIEIRKENYRLFTPIAKDFVRTVLYQQFSMFIPKGVKERTDYITRILHSTKDEYVIPYEMTGTMDELIHKLRADEITPEEFVKFAKAERNKHQQTINPSQVGDVSEVLASVQDNFLVNSESNKKPQGEMEIIPMPPILCMDVETKLRILKTEECTPVLQNNRMFMALTDKMVSHKRIFFTNPHTTRIIWSMHRLIYIFTDAYNKNTLYYDLELTRKIPDTTGGRTIRSATIITKDKIFVPIVEELYEYFNLNMDDKLKFYVHFDEVVNN